MNSQHVTITAGTACPYCCFRAFTVLAEVRHMQAAHPDIIEERQRAAGTFRPPPDWRAEVPEPEPVPCAARLSMEITVTLQDEAVNFTLDQVRDAAERALTHRSEPLVNTPDAWVSITHARAISAEILP